MYDVNRITHLGDIPDNISNLLIELEEFKECFNVKLEYFQNKYKIFLRGFNIKYGVKIRRNIFIQISENPCSYSIQMFSTPVQNSNSGELKKIYDIVVNGENNFRVIKKDVKDLIEGKKGASLSSNYPL